MGASIFVQNTQKLSRSFGERDSRYTFRRKNETARESAADEEAPIREHTSNETKKTLLIRSQFVWNFEHSN